MSSVQPNKHVFVAVLKTCASAADLAAGKSVHAHICATAGKSTVFAPSCLINMYFKCGGIEDAHTVFDSLTHKNVVAWTAMMSGYVQQEMGQEALHLYTAMQQAALCPVTAVTFCVPPAGLCNPTRISSSAREQIHAQIRK